MNPIRILTVLSVAALAAGCAGLGTTSAAPPAADMPPMAMGEGGPMRAMDSRMTAMHAMHQKMMNAGTPAECQALMSDHLKAMQGDMAQHHQMMAEHLAMMQRMLDMMAERMPPAATGR